MFHILFCALPNKRYYTKAFFNITTSIIAVISRSGSHCLYLKSVPYQMALWRLFPETFEAHNAMGKLPPEWPTISGTSRRRKGYPLSEMAVIYAIKTPENDPGMNLPFLIGKALDKRGLLYNWIFEDYRAKRSCDVTTASVTISPSTV